MGRHAVRLAATAGVFGVLVVGGCSQPIRAPEQSPSPDRGARSQAALEELVVAPDTEPGCSAVVGERGRVLWQGQAGLGVLQPATPITAETTFHIGSVSKQFTALAAALLAEDGRLSLDDTVAEHLDGYPDWAEQVTLSQLIHHTSGIPEVIKLMSLRGTELDTKASREDLLEAIREVKTLDFEPGSQWAYSNSNYLLLGLIVEQTSGRPLATHLAQTFFSPLDLTMALEPPGSSFDRYPVLSGHCAGTVRGRRLAMGPQWARRDLGDADRPDPLGRRLPHRSGGRGTRHEAADRRGRPAPTATAATDSASSSRQMVSCGTTA